MQIFIFDDEKAAAQYGALRIAEAARTAIAERGIFSLAVSGGKSPWGMLSRLAKAEVRWPDIHIFQVDERIVPPDRPERNFAGLRTALLSRVPIPADNIHPMPVDMEDAEVAAEEYRRTLTAVLGNPAVLDLVHLGLGTDGHTASLVPGHGPVAAGDVTVSPAYEGVSRLTLTYSMLNRSHSILWYVIGEDKAPALARMVAGDTGIPAGRIERSRAIVIADKAASRLLGKTPA